MRVIDTDGHPVTVKRLNPTTSAVVTTDTAVDIFTAVTGKRIFVSKVYATNFKTGEYSTILIATDNATPVTVGYIQPGNPTAAADQAADSIEFTPYYEVPAGETITAETVDTTTGDYYVTAHGYVET